MNGATILRRLEADGILRVLPEPVVPAPLLVLAQSIACGSDLRSSREAQRYQCVQTLGVYRLRRRWAELFALTGEPMYAAWEAVRREGERNFQRTNVSNARHWLVRQRAYEAGAPLLPMTRQPIGATS